MAPQVVLAVTDNRDTFSKVLLAGALSSPSAHDSPSARDSRCDNMFNSISDAATRWLAALSHPRPNYPVADVSKSLVGLLHLASDAALAIIDEPQMCQAPDPTEAFMDVASGSCKPRRNILFRLLGVILECLPGPHTNARAKCASVTRGESTAVAKADRKDAKKIRKKALRSVARMAMESLQKLAGHVNGAPALKHVIEVIDKKCDGRGAARHGRGERSAASDDGGDEMQEKSKTLTGMGQDVCDAFATAFASGITVGLQVNVDKSFLS